MSRELKFRAWFIKESKYLFTSVEVTIALMEEKTTLEILQASSGPIGFSNPLYDDIFEFEQFTGLKDKNGKEIYEGDLVRCTLDKAFVQKAVFIVEIKYSNYAAAYKALIRKVEKWEKYNVEPPEENMSERWFTTMVESFDFEVIGTIRKNPELLK